jgi:hypothetical protein
MAASASNATTGPAAAGPAALPTPAHSVTGSISQPDSMITDESPQKRKRPLDDIGERDQKKVHLDDAKLGIEDLHLDVGYKYLLSQIRKAFPLLLPFVTRSRFFL